MSCKLIHSDSSSTSNIIPPFSLFNVFIHTLSYPSVIMSFFLYPDPAVTMISETSGSFFIKGDTKSYSLDITLENVAAVASGNNIPAAPGSNNNFVFTAHLSDVDLSGAGTDTLSISAALVSSDDLLQSLEASTSVMISGTADLMTPSTSVQCTNAQYLCVTVAVGSGALYMDVDTSAGSNTVCSDISSVKTCDPSKYFHTCGFILFDKYINSNITM